MSAGVTDDKIVELAEAIGRKTERAMARVMVDYYTAFGDWPERLVVETAITDDLKVTIKVYAASPVTPLEPVAWPTSRQVFDIPEGLDTAGMLKVLHEALAGVDDG